MKITIESTTKIVTLVADDGNSMQARVWQGASESGIPVQCFITRIAPEISKSDPRIDEVTLKFEAELTLCADPRPTVAGIPTRLLID